MRLADLTMMELPEAMAWLAHASGEDVADIINGLLRMQQHHQRIRRTHSLSVSIQMTDHPGSIQPGAPPAWDTSITIDDGGLNTVSVNAMSGRASCVGALAAYLVRCAEIRAQQERPAAHE